MARFIFRNLSARPGLTLASIAGAAAGMAIIIGSLVVGNSVRATLHGLALRRIGPVTTAVVSVHGLDSSLAKSLALACGTDERGLALAPLSMVAATATSAGAAAGDDAGDSERAVNLLGVGESFWRMAWGESSAATILPPGSARISAGVAEALGVGVGDDIVLTVGRGSTGAGDSVFGRRELALTRLRVTVSAVLDGGAGNFSIDAGRAGSGGSGGAGAGNVFVDLAWLNRQLDQGDRANMIVAGEATSALSADDAAAISNQIREALPGRVSLRDYGLRLVAEEGGANRVAIESERIVFDPRQVAAVVAAAGGPDVEIMPVSAYLMNSVRKVSGGGGAGRGEVPYVMLAGMDLSSPLVRLSPESQELPAEGVQLRLGAGEVLVNAHLAEELQLAAGDELEVQFYRVLADGSLGESGRRLRVAGVVGMAGSGADGLLVPHVEGLTESLDVRSWNPPFPVDQRRIEDRDEAYWDAHGAAPRMLVSPATARDIWSQALSPTSGGGGERYITGLLMKTSSEESVQTLATRLAADLQPEVMGVAVRNVRDEALAAARGSSDYTGLFVGLGAFLVVASALLVALLGRLNVERRAGQTGLLLAVGFTRRQCARLLAGEALVLTVLAALLAVPLGVAYGAGLMAGLNVLWPEALAGLRIALHVSWLSVLTGVVFGGLAAAVALGWGLAGLRGRSVLELLAGWRSYSAATAMDGRADRVQRRLRIGSVVGALLVAMGVGAVAAGYLQLWSTVAAFFAGGVMLLSGGLMLMWSRMGALAPAAIGGGWGLNRLAWQWLGRNRMRSLLTMSLIATAAFALAAVAANRREAEVLGNAGAVSRSGGAGGYQLKIETQLPLPVPLNAYLSRQMAESPARGDEALVRAMHVDSLRVQQGDDISCLNIAQPLSPRVVGVGAAMVERGGFRLAGHEPSAGVSADELAERPLRLLEVRGDENDRAIPVMGDEASLRWILGRRLGELFEIDSPRGPLKVRLVGMLKGSIWQSELLMSEENFVHAFGAEGGYGLFLAEVADDGVDRAAASLADRLSAVGVRVTPTAGMLAEFASVQNAYLATFQTLGGLGLGLGMLGLVTVMFRAAEERRRELALLRAIGFSRRSLLRLLVTEAGMLLTIGLAIGALAALVAVLPQVMASAGAVPWSALGLTLAGVWVFGLACCAAAAWRISRSDLLSSLRRE